MKHIKNLFKVTLLSFLAFSLSGCDFINNLIPSTSDKSDTSGETSGGGESSGGGQSSGTSSIPSDRPSLNVKTDDQLTYDSEQDCFRLVLPYDDEYTLDVSINNNDGKSNVVYDVISGKDYITFTNKVIKNVNTYDFTMTSCISIGLQQNGKKIESKFLYVSSVSFKQSLKIKFTEDEQMMFHNDEYILKMKPNGDTYSLNGRIEGKTGSHTLSLAYELSSEAYATLSDNVVTSKNADSYGLSTLLKVNIMEDGSVLRYDILHICFVKDYDEYLTNDPTKNYSEAPDIVLTSKDERITIEEKQYRSPSKYHILYPYAGNYYNFPEIKVINYDGQADFRFTPINNCNVDFIPSTLSIVFREKEGTALWNRAVFKIDAYDENEHIVASIYATLRQTQEGRGEYNAFYNGNQELIDGEEIILQRGSEYPVTIKYNGAISTIAANQLTSENLSVLGIESYNMAAKVVNLLPKTVGETSLTISSKRIDYNKDEFEYSITVTVKVIDEAIPTAIYIVNGGNGISISGDDIFVTSRVYVIYDTGVTRIINGNPNLTYVKEDTANPNVKNVTLTYTENGHTVSETYEVEVNKSGYQKQKITFGFQEARNAIYSSVSPNKGNVKALALPIWMSNSSDFINDSKVDGNGKTQKEQIREDIQTALDGDSSLTSYRTVSDYLEEITENRLHLTANVSEWYTDTHSNTYYERASDSLRQLVVDATKAYFANHPEEDFSEYDIDGNGAVDYLFVIYGANYQANKWYRAYAINYYARKDIVKDYFVAPFAFLYGYQGVTNLETQTSIDDLSDLNNGLISSNTIIHETCHLLGARDAYDETSNGISITDERKNSPCGLFTMQDNNIGTHDAFNYLAMGLVDPYIFDASDTSLPNDIEFTINEFNATHDYVILTNHWDKDRQVFDEYFVLELYANNGLNKGAGTKYYADLSVPGIKVWHVNGVLGDDYWPLYNNDNNGNNFDLVHFIRNDKSVGYKTNTMAESKYFFKAGDSFALEDYKAQLYHNDGKLDSGATFRWTFSVNSITSDAYGFSKATITLHK